MPPMYSREGAVKLTPHQRMILEALDKGAMLTVNSHNCLFLLEKMLQPVTREFLVKNRLVERFDKTRNVSVQGNGFVITDKGRSVLSD